MRYCISVFLLILLSCSKEEFNVQELNIPLGHLTIGVGSGAFHHSLDGAGVVYFITDRGPNIPVNEGTIKEGKVFPFPEFTPSIYKIRLTSSSYEVLEIIKLKDDEGELLTGISNPGTELSYDISGKTIKYDPNGLDTEAIVKLKDGTFWVSDEYAPSLIHLDKTGRVISRLVPEGVGPSLKGTTLKTQERLPAIIAKRKLNRGIEALAISTDESYLYFMMQSPLAHPSRAVCKFSRTVRLFRLDLKTEKVDAEYIYVIDRPDTFNDDKGIEQGDIKISEMIMRDSQELIVLERAENTTKFYSINLANATNVFGWNWDSVLKKPALEELDPSSLSLHGINVVPKQLLLDTSKGGRVFPSKLEGMAYLGNGLWVLINDNDFGINGARTKLVITNTSLN